VRSLHDAMPRYTQGMMDLGATVCAAKKPACGPARSRSHVWRGALAIPNAIREDPKTQTQFTVDLATVGTGPGRFRVAEQAPTPGVWAWLHCFPFSIVAKAWNRGS